MRMSLVRILQLLFRRRWIIVNVWVVTVIFIMAASYLVPPLYQSSAKFLVIPGNEQLPIFTLSSTVADRVVSATPQSGDVLSEIELLESRPVLERVVDRLGLDRPNAPGTDAPQRRGGLVGWLSDMLGGFNAGLNNLYVELGLVTVGDPHEAAIGALRAGMKVQPVALSSVFTLDFAGRNADTTARIVNALAAEYLAYRRDVYKPVGIVEHFEQKLDEQKANLKAAEARLQAYQDKYGIANLEVETEGTLRLLEEAKKNGAFNRQVDQYESRLAVLREAAPVMRDLRFEVANSQSLYERYLQKYDEVSSNAELSDAKFANVRLIEPGSVSSAPVFPHRLLNAFLSLILGAFGGVGAALALNYLSNKLNTIEDVENTGLPALGSVPRLRRLSKTRQALTADYGGEAFAFIAEQVLGTCASGFVLSGAAAHVGCTTVSAGLALAIAKHGDRRLLVIEADGRQPTLHQLFRAPDASPAERFPENQRNLPRLIHPTRYANIDVLTVSHDNARELDGRAIQTLLGTCDAPYDFVIVDAPPLFASATAFALAKGMKGWGVILVLEAGRTSAQLVRRAAELVQRQGIALFGAVLNKREDSVPEFIYRRL